MSRDPYDKIADLYDVYVQTDLDIPFFVAEAQRTSGKVLELMVGTGRVTLPLVQAGADLVAVDRAGKLLDVLRAKLAAQGLSAQVITQDVRQLALEDRFALVLIPFHAFPEITDPVEQLETLRRIHAHMTPGARCIITLHNPEVRRRSIDDQLRLVARRPHGEGELLFWLLQQYDVASRQVTVLEFFEEYDADGIMQRRRMVDLRFTLLEQAAFEDLIAQAGFRVLDIYGDYQRSPFDPASSPFMIYVLGRAE